MTDIDYMRKTLSKKKREREVKINHLKPISVSCLLCYCIERFYFFKSVYAIIYNFLLLSFLFLYVFVTCCFNFFIYLFESLKNT